MTPTAVVTPSAASATKRGEHVSFSQLDQYLRCPLRYSFVYMDRLEPDFVPAARAFGSGIHASAAYFFRAAAQGKCRGSRTCRATSRRSGIMLVIPVKGSRRDSVPVGVPGGRSRGTAAGRPAEVRGSVVAPGI